MAEQLVGIPPLPGPYEIFDIADKGTLSTRILRWETGQALIQTTAVPAGKWVEVLRIHVPPEVTRPRLPYIDITSKTLCAQLKPLLPELVARGVAIKITKHGVAPAARFSVEVG